MQHRRCPIYRTEIDFSVEGPCLKFLDMPLEDFTRIPSKELEKQRSNELMPSEHLTPTADLVYPLAQINTVSLNPNIHSVPWIFSGNQSGIGRLHILKAIR